jgi:glycoprotein-N-acetylgalactosamine 3-beta-galactosyltransferase
MAKTKEAFKYVYKKHLNEYDWFMKADDDTYVIVENLRYFLHDKDPKSPTYYGLKRYIFRIKEVGNVQKVYCVCHTCLAE